MDVTEYGDTHEERARELTETGISIRRSGKGIFRALADALNPEEERRTVLVGDTYETPEDAAQYAADETEALKVLGADDEA